MKSRLLKWRSRSEEEAGSCVVGDCERDEEREVTFKTKKSDKEKIRITVISTIMIN